MNIKFNTKALNNSNLPDSKVFVTFAANTSDMVYGTGPTQETINFSGNDITIKGTVYGTSAAYSLKDIKTNGLVLNSATSLVGFISYGSAKGIEKLASGSQPNFLDPSTPRYSIFEISYDGTSGGADITNISQFGASISMEFKDSSGTVQTKVGNSLSTTDTFNALAKASSFSGSKSTSAIVLDSNGEFVRAIGTNVFPNGTVQTPFPTFNAYLQSLYATYGSKSVVVDLTNLAPGASPGGIGAAGFPSSTNAINVTKSIPKKGKTPAVPMIYNLDYHFTAIVTQVTAPDPSNNDPYGTYSVELKGYVNATCTDEATEPIKSYKYDNLSIKISADKLASNELYMTNFIYMASTTGAGINLESSGWDALNTDFGSATVQGALLQKAAGDFAEGITCGFPGSITPSTSTPGTNLGDLSSYEWWKNPQLAYLKAQPKNAYYSLYGNAVYANSGGINGVTFTVGGVYGSPYDDRFGLNLISPDANTTDMVISLLADGDLKPITDK